MITFKAKTKSGEIINSALSEFTFPAGEKHIKREDRRELEPVEIAILQADEKLHDDLFQLAIWNNYLLLRDSDVKRVLILPYAPAARADRGEPFGADVYGHFIADMMLDQVIIFDPHSPVIVGKLQSEHRDGVTVVNPSDLFDEFFVKKTFQTNNYNAVLVPDKGALDRATQVAEVLGLPVLTVNKERDFETGKLLKFELPELEEGGRYLIVDDICDGGGTFIGIDKAVVEDDVKLDLFVSHGVFSKSAVFTLPDHFYNIYTTNSYNAGRDLPTGFRRFDIIRLLTKTVVLSSL